MNLKSSLKLEPGIEVEEVIMSDQKLLVKCHQCGAKNKIALLGSTLRAVCGRCKSALEILEKPVHVSARDFDEEVLKWPGLVLVDFWAEWCGPCRTVAPVLNQIARERAGRLIVAKVNTEEEPQLAARYRIRSIPALLMFRDGKLIDQVAGALPKAELERWIDSSSLLI